MNIFKFPQKNTKCRAIFLASSAILFFSALALLYLGKDTRNFRHFCNDFFVSELTGNTLNMHYTVAHPENYGIRSYTPQLPSYSREKVKNSGRELEEAIHTLRSLKENRLSREDGYTYRLLLSYLENERLGMDLYYYSNPLSPSSGMQSQLPILLAEYTFRTRQDVTDYLALLEQTDTCFECITDYLKDQASQGLFMPDYSADKVIQQCDEIMDPSLLQSQTHFLNTTFEERLDTLVEQRMITPAEKDSYIAENFRLLTTVMLPAYQKLGDELLLLKGSGKNEEGLCHYPQGQEYYLHLIRSNTGSPRKIKEIKYLLTQDLNRNLRALTSLLQDNPNPAGADPVPPFAYRLPEDMLKSLQRMMASSFPSLASVAEDTMPVCTVKSVSSNLQEYCSPAFYLTPPLDDIRENVIYINHRNNPTGVELYTTLAHEGYPGHLYQTVYSQLFFQKTKVNPIRSILSYGGYVEGWAMYVELISYDYAKVLMKEKAPETETLYEICKLDRQIQLCLYSLLDIAIHYDGASCRQVHEMLSAIGISNPDTTRAIYEYITEEPANYLKYYLGYLEILSLKAQAKKLWGKAYNEYCFHKFYLENGPADFSSLQIQLRQFPCEGLYSKASFSLPAISLIHPSAKGLSSPTSSSILIKKSEAESLQSFK